jgi:hypothetical protein
MLREEEIIQAIERQRWWLGSKGKICYLFTKLKLPFPTMKMSERELLLLSILTKILNSNPKEEARLEGLGELVDEVKLYKEISIEELFVEIDNKLRQIDPTDNLGWRDKKIRLPKLLELLKLLGFIKLKFKGSHKDRKEVVYVLERFSIEDIVERFNFNFNGISQI